MADSNSPRMSVSSPSDSEQTREERSARDLPRVPPPGWDADLWSEFRYGAIYEQEVPRDCDGEPLFDGDGNPRRRYV